MIFRLSLAILAITTPLGACTAISGDRILGADLASVHPSFVPLDPAIVIGPAPSAGTQRTFRSFELDRLAKEHAISIDPGAASEVCFTRTTMRLDETLLAPILRAALDSQPRTADASLEIADFSRNALPVGTPEFSVEGLSESGLWRGRLLYGENRSVPIWARVRVTGTSGKPVAAARSASPGVLRGDNVRVEVVSGGVRLAFDAAAESSGHVGEQVTVKNPSGGQRFRAVVEAPGKVRIEK
jgi:hypothetical protein